VVQKYFVCLFSGDSRSKSIIISIVDNTGGKESFFFFWYKYACSTEQLWRRWDKKFPQPLKHLLMILKRHNTIVFLGKVKCKYQSRDGWIVVIASPHFLWAWQSMDWGRGWIASSRKASSQWQGGLSLRVKRSNLFMFMDCFADVYGLLRWKARNDGGDGLLRRGRPPRNDGGSSLGMMSYLWILC